MLVAKTDSGARAQHLESLGMDKGLRCGVEIKQMYSVTRDGGFDKGDRT